MAPVPSHSPDPGPERLGKLAVALAALLALLYGLGHLNWYLGTPLGRVPVLDERENLDLANAIASGTLPAAPFYRAPGYAAVLAALRALFAPEAGLFAAALVMGILLHAVGACLAARIAGRWFGAVPAVAAGALYALNPVLVHFAAQALDTTLGLVLFMAGLDQLTAALSGGSRLSWGLASLAWAAAVLVRPNYLLAWALLPALALALSGTAKPARLAWSLAGVVLFSAQSGWQWRLCGQAGFLPWQGAYNLWSANRPGSNGLYYAQQVSLPPELARQNPARAESVILYTQEAPGAPTDVASMNAHWRARFLDEALHHPLRWSALLTRKAYALLNNWEQYNNKTYLFHKARSPWLRWNPLGFGILLVLSVAGAARLARLAPVQGAAAALVALALAASVLLFYASDRFRLPLAGLATVVGAGALAPLSSWGALRGRVLAGMVMAAVVTFSAVGHVQTRETIVQDHVLLARAAFTVGDDRLALGEAEEALALQPWHPDAKAVAAAARAEMATGKGSAP